MRYKKLLRNYYYMTELNDGIREHPELVRAAIMRLTKRQRKRLIKNCAFWIEALTEAEKEAYREIWGHDEPADSPE